MIGLRFGKETSYCVIDIDRGSVYHPFNSYSGYKDVLATLEGIGLCRPQVVRSSDSDGIHFYYFLSKPMPTFNLAKAIKFALEDAGLQLRSGQLESFPNVKAYAKHGKSLYNGHRLPLQVGSYWLDDDLQPISNDVAQFLDAADVAAAHQDLTALKKAIAAAEKRSLFNGSSRTSADVQRRKREIEKEIAEGWTANHQTNNLLIRIANHARFWLALSDKALVDYIEATAIAAPGYKEYCRHQHEIRKRAAEVAKMAEDYWTPYRSYPARCGKSYQATFSPQGQQNNIVNFSQPNQANIQRSQQAAERIRQAVDHLKAANMLFAGVTARRAAIIDTVKELTGSSMSPSTLYQDCHLSLWHPGHQESPEPAQGAAVQAVLEVEHTQKSPEPAQGAAVQAVSPYEVYVCEACLPETSQKVSKQVEEICIAPEEEEREEEVLAVIPMTSEQPEWQAALKFPSVDNSEDAMRTSRIFVSAKVRAKSDVNSLERIEGRKFCDEERSRCLTVATYRRLWESGDPMWMDEVRLWAGDNSWRLPEPKQSLSLSWWIALYWGYQPQCTVKSLKLSTT